MESYTTVIGEGVFEYEDRKSIFISTAVPVQNESQVLDFIQFIKKKYPDARHHVYAYVLRENSIMRFSDDREPQGTAGMPTLDAIRKNGCTDVCVVTIRYFGGTLLGTGGLVRAYSAAAVGAIEKAGIVTFDIYSTISIKAGYSDYQKIIGFIQTTEFRTKDTNYTDNVIITGSIKKSLCDDFMKSINDITSARAETEIIEEKFEY